MRVLLMTKKDIRSPLQIGIRHRLSLMCMLVLTVFASSIRATDKSGALMLSVVPAAAQATADLLDPQNPMWNIIADNPLHLNRTPPLYDGDPQDNGKRPTASIRLCRTTGGDLVIRVTWTDSTEDKKADDVRYQDGGASHIYTKHSQATDRFPDAFCAMVPVARGAAKTYPSMMMGSTENPAELYYWRAGTGFQLLNAHGRASTSETKTAIHGTVTRQSDGYVIVMILPNMLPRTPVCFAIWDGTAKQRDGMKYASLWYEVER
ncbi:MAG: hypothetical protein Q7T18_06365 [Sedimentisphaerales bacterium]|nr:hypothetical protein [Sedimentisphaerales bacterium]